MEYDLNFEADYKIARLINQTAEKAKQKIYNEDDD